MCGEGQLYQNAVHVIVLVEASDQRQQILLAHVGRQAMTERLDGAVFALLRLGPHVDLARRIVADKNDGKAGRQMVVLAQVGDFVAHPPAQSVGNSASIDAGGFGLGVHGGRHPCSQHKPRARHQPVSRVCS